MFIAIVLAVAACGGEPRISVNVPDVVVNVPPQEALIVNVTIEEAPQTETSTVVPCGGRCGTGTYCDEHNQCVVAPTCSDTNCCGDDTRWNGATCVPEASCLDETCCTEESAWDPETGDCGWLTECFGAECCGKGTVLTALGVCVPIGSATTLCRPNDDAVLVSGNVSDLVSLRSGDSNVELLDIYLIACRDLSERGFSAWVNSTTETSSTSNLFLEDGSPRFINFQLDLLGVLQLHGDMVPSSWSPGTVGTVSFQDPQTSRGISQGVVAHYKLSVSVAANLVPQHEGFVVGILGTTITLANFPNSGARLRWLYNLQEISLDPY
jgi:hypothetical protein